MKSSARRNAKILVVCYGNPLRGDDGAGLAVAQDLEEVIDPRSATVLYRHQLVPELAETLSEAELAIFVDAEEGSGMPGSIAMRVIEPGKSGPESFTHEYDPASLRAYTEHLYGRSPQCELYTLQGQNFDYGMELSPVVRKSIAKFVQVLSKRIRQGVKEPRHA